MHKKSFAGRRIHPSIIRVKKTRVEQTASLLRIIKRKLIQDGIIEDPAKRKSRYVFKWSYGQIAGETFADNTSNARAMIKKELGLGKNKRLPMEINLIRSLNL